MSGTTMVILSAFVAYLLLMIVIGEKNKQLGRLFSGRTWTECMGSCSFSTGIRYERMALNGTSGSDLFTGNRTDLDCCRSVHRNCIKLGVYFTQTS